MTTRPLRLTSQLALASLASLLVVACQSGLVAPPTDAGSAAVGEGGPTNGGKPTGGVGHVVGTFPRDVLAVALDDTYLYAGVFQAIYRLPRDGSGKAHLLATTSSFNGGIAVDDTNVYWTNLCGTDPNCEQGEVQSMPKAGGTVTTLASAQLRPGTLVADDTHLYWTNQGYDGPEPFGGGQVVSMPKTGGTPLVLVDNLKLADSLAFDGSDGLVFHAYNIVGRVPKSGGAQTTLENLVDGFYVSNFVVAGTQLYFWMGMDNTGPMLSVATNANDTAAPSVGPSGTVLVPSVTVSALATLGTTTLLWGSGSQDTVGEIWAMNLADGTTSVFASSDQADPATGLIPLSTAGLVADAKGVYSLEYRAPYSATLETIVRAFPLQ